MVSRIEMEQQKALKRERRRQIAKRIAKQRKEDQQKRKLDKLTRQRSYSPTTGDKRSGIQLVDTFCGIQEGFMGIRPIFGPLTKPIEVQVDLPPVRIGAFD